MISGRHEPDMALSTTDIQIGAVEIKDASATTRANVTAANTARTTGTIVLVVQNVDAEGDVADWSDLDDIRIGTEDIRTLDRNEAVASSGAKLDADLSASKEQTSLTQGKTYMWTSIDGIVLVGIADTGAGGSTAANVLWTIPAGHTEYITLPSGISSLFYTALTENVTVYTSNVVNT